MITISLGADCVVTFRKTCYGQMSSIHALYLDHLLIPEILPTSVFSLIKMCCSYKFDSLPFIIVCCSVLLSCMLVLQGESRKWVITQPELLKLAFLAWNPLENAYSILYSVNCKIVNSSFGSWFEALFFIVSL